MPETARASSLTPLTCRTSLAVASGLAAAAHGQFLFRVRQVTLQLLSLVQERSDTSGHLFKRNFKLCRRCFNDLKLFISGLAGGISGQSLDPAHAGRHPCLADQRNEPDIAGPAHVGAAA